MNYSIDVIVPVYNVARYLDRFFNSLINQTISNFRIITVYDVSTDNSLEVLEHYQKTLGDERFVILFSTKKDGLGAARDFALNSGMIHSKYVSFLDPDDFLENNYFEKMLHKIEATNSDICICGFNRIDEATNSIVKVDMVNNPDALEKPLEYFGLPFFNTSVWNKLYRYDLVKDYRFTNVKRSEDVCYFALTFSKARRICFINEPLYNYLLRDSSLSASYSIVHVNQLLELVKQVKSILSERETKLLADVLFIRLSIGTVMRITTNSKKDGKKCAKLIRGFLLQNFNRFCTFNNLGFFNSIKKGKLVFGAVILRKLYKVCTLFPIIAHYCRTSRKKKRIVSW